MTTVVLHGLGSDSRHVLEQLGPALPDDVRAPDVRAHGASPLVGGPDDFRLDALARELPLPESPLTIVGVSMGAALAVRLALARADSPGRVERLVLIRPAFTHEPVPANLTAFPVLGELLSRFGPAEGERRFRRSLQFHAIELESRSTAAALRAQFRAPRAVERAIRLTEIPRNRAGTVDEFARIAVPALVVAAPRDPVHPVAVAEAWAGALPGAQLVDVPARDSGHSRYLDALRARVRSALSARE